MDESPTSPPDLEALWELAPVRAERRFEASMVADLPEPARRFLAHSIAPGTALAGAVRLRMRGEIRIGKWFEFEAEQVIVWERGLIWRARAHRGPVSVKGFDRIVDGVGEMRWRLFGLVPVMTASGPDITRSATGRHEIESMLLPSALLAPGTSWSSSDRAHADVSVCHQGQHAAVHLTLGEDGGLRSAWIDRWGNPDGGAFAEVPFGVVVDEEGCFGGYTIPTKLRVGWHFRDGGFGPAGESFRAEILAAEYR